MYKDMMQLPLLRSASNFEVYACSPHMRVRVRVCTHGKDNCDRYSHSFLSPSSVFHASLFTLHLLINII